MKFNPSTPPESSDWTALRYWLSEEFQSVMKALLQVEDILLPELHAAPKKPRTGMIVLADGTDWNPGSGAGFYGYQNGTWNKLG